MNNDLPVSLLIAAFSGALILMLPHLSPRRYFFAILVPADFRSSATARAALTRYHIAVLCGVATTVAVLIWQQSQTAILEVAAMLIPAVIGGAAFLWERRRIAHLASPADQTRVVELTADDDRLPRWVAFALLAFALPLAAAAWLRAHWSEIPQRFPIHWNIHDEADGWAEKSVRGVYGPLLFAGGMMLVMLLLALAMFYGSRRGRQRTATIQIMVATVYFLALIFSATALMPAVHFSPSILLIPGIGFPLIVLAWAFKMASDPDMPVDQTPDECWYLGSIYVNAKDPAMFVQKRIGFGYTINMGNRLAWIVMGGFVAALVGLIFVLPG
jgi:uncharacterized membrane protein